MRIFTSLHILSILLMLLTAGQVRAANISNESIPFKGMVANPNDARNLIAQNMKALAPLASNAGVKIVHLQSVFYRLTPVAMGYSIEGSLSVDVVPEDKTSDFVELLKKNGQEAKIEYFATCAPGSR